MKLGGITNYAYICNSITENLMNFLFVPEHNGMFSDLTDRLLCQASEKSISTRRTVSDKLSYHEDERTYTGPASGNEQGNL